MITRDASALQSREAPVGNTAQPTKNLPALAAPVDCLIDWIQGLLSLPVAKVPEVLILFSSLFREEGTLIDCIGKSFGATKLPHGSKTLNGQRFAWSDTDDHDMVNLWFSIPGRVTSRVEPLTLVKGVSSILAPYQFKISRIDCALDDFSKTLNAAYIDEMQAQKRFVGNPTITPIGYADQPGWTRYIGSRRSFVYVRLYDKFHQSNGLIDANRLEAEFKGRVANEHWQNLQALAFDSKTIAAYIVESVTGSFRIVDDSNSQKYLCGVEPTFKKFLDHCSSEGGFRVPQPRRESSLSKTMQWLERSVKSSLATVKKTLGNDRFKNYLDRLLKDGATAMNKTQENIVNLLHNGEDSLNGKKIKLKPVKSYKNFINRTVTKPVNEIVNEIVNDVIPFIPIQLAINQV